MSSSGEKLTRQLKEDRKKLVREMRVARDKLKRGSPSQITGIPQHIVNRESPRTTTLYDCDRMRFRSMTVERKTIWLIR
jgi:hypothetical protein